MKYYVWLFIGFMFGIIAAVIITMICNYLFVVRESIIVQRRRLRALQIIPLVVNTTNFDIDDEASDSYTLSIENKEETKEPEDFFIRIAENI